MSPLTALWVASITGASLFFVSGVLSADAVYRWLGLRSRHAPPGPWAGEPSASTHPGQPAPPADGQWLVEVSQARVLAQSARREAEMVREQLEIELANRSALDDELEHAHARAEEAIRRSSDNQMSASLVPGLKKRLEEIEQVQASKARAVAQSEEKMRSLERELARSRDDTERLRAQLAARVDTHTASLSNDVQRLNQQHVERNLRVQMPSDRVAELEAYAEENTELRGERDGLRREVERLRLSAREPVEMPSAPARAQVDAAGVTHITRASQRGTTRRVRESENTLESSLVQSLSSLVLREPGVVAVLSDDNGFPVAGVGSDPLQESLSALTSLAQDLAFRVKELVDLERIERLELADAAGRALRLRFFDWETHALALTCLGKRSLVANPDEERVISAFPKLLRRAWSA
jgi:hypothetical protein